jgi:hypothetical protein
MKKGLVLVVGIFILLLPFVSAKAFTWSISAVDHEMPAANYSGGWGAGVYLNRTMNISATWGYGWKDERHCKTSYRQSLYLNGTRVAIMECHSNEGCKYNDNAAAQEWIWEGCVQYAVARDGGSWVGPSKPLPNISIMADTIAGEYCFKDDGGDDCRGAAGGFSGFQYDELLAYKDMAGNVNINDGENGDGVKDLTPDGLGAVISLKYANTVRIKSVTPQVMVWIGTEEDKTETSTIDLVNSHVFACNDFDNNKICDGLEPNAIACKNTYNGSSFKGFCCGRDVTACGFVQNITKPIQVYIVRDGSGNIAQISKDPILDTYRRAISIPVTISMIYVSRDSGNNIANIRDTTATGFSPVSTEAVGKHCTATGMFGRQQTCVWTLSPSSGDSPVSLGILYNISAYCGNNSEGEWEWAALEDTGEVHHLSNCPNATIVSNGSNFFSCGPSIPGVQPINGFLGITVDNKATHEYSCANSVINECGGEWGTFSSNSYMLTGTIAPNLEQTYYCASDGDWTTDLDIKDAISCEKAGFKSTGAYCCSEADDPDETYNDPAYPNGLGGCWRKAYVPSGQFAVPDRVINYRGMFFGCFVGNLSLLGVLDTHTNKPVINNSDLTSECGAVLFDANPGGMGPGGEFGVHAKCNLNGRWTFTDEPGGTFRKTIKWLGLANITAPMNESGCCADNQCWNGTSCQKVGSYYRVGDEAYVCRLQPKAAG